MNREIAFIIEEFNSSGGLKIVTSIANLLDDEGISVCIFAPKYSNAPFYPLNKGIKVNYLGSKSCGGKIFYFLHLFLTIKQVTCTLVTPNFRIAVICKWAFQFINKHHILVLLIQGEDSVSLIKYSSSNKIVKWLNSKIYRVSTKIDAERVFVSNYLKANYPRRGVQIPNYISDYYQKLPSRSLFKNEYITVGTVSTSAPNKGFDLFLRCLDKIVSSHEHNDIKFKFLCATQDQLLINSKKDHQICFISPNTEADMSSFYQKCDFYVSCSISEGFNLPVLEAMASGCIVITTKDGGVTDFIIDGENGFLAAIRDPHCISDLISNLVQNKALLSDIQEKAKLTSQQYTKDKFNATYLDFFKKLV